MIRSICNHAEFESNKVSMHGTLHLYSLLGSPYFLGLILLSAPNEHSPNSEWANDIVRIDGFSSFWARRIINGQSTLSGTECVCINLFGWWHSTFFRLSDPLSLWPIDGEHFSHEWWSLSSPSALPHRPSSRWISRVTATKTDALSSYLLLLWIELTLHRLWEVKSSECLFHRQIMMDDQWLRCVTTTAQYTDCWCGKYRIEWITKV